MAKCNSTENGKFREKSEICLEFIFLQFSRILEFVICSGIAKNAMMIKNRNW